ncbi:MAG: DUF881 domain-containing protein [Nakamurella sp.]
MSGPQDGARDGPSTAGTAAVHTSHGTPRRRRSVTAVVAFILVALLGFGFVTQLRSTAAGDNLEALRSDDLVQILDGLQQREDDLNAEIRTQEATLQGLLAGGASSGEALAEARKQASELEIINGVAPAAGPGITLRIGDPARAVSPEFLLDTVQELRNAGAEAIQIGAVRIGVDSAFVGDAASLQIDGKPVSRPISVKAIGEPATLAAAMSIPGGVVDSVRRVGATIDVGQSRSISITALRTPRAPIYARPAG